MTHDTVKTDQRVFSFDTHKKVVIKQHIINNFKTKIFLRIYYDFQDKNFVQWSLYAGNKRPGTSFKLSLVALYRWSLYIENFDVKN